MATIIDPSDSNRYEVVQVKNFDTVPLSVVINPANATPTPATDAFNRLRTSGPLTLFDSSHRYSDNGLWVNSITSGGTATFNANEGLVDLAVTTTSGSEIIRETTKVFSYQPGKSLLVLNTFIFNSAKTNLRQRVGYFGSDNGIYFEQAGTTLNFVERSSVTGAPSETRISQSNWSIDRLDGTGPSGITLDTTKAQILWMDIEWLGVGSVRIGFVIDGKFIHCHTFQHANRISSTYITTATLPLRYEITNTGLTTSSSTLKQVCSTVISEGGYELRGLQQSIGTPITSRYQLSTAGTFSPVVSIRLKSSPDRLDAIVIITAISCIADTASNFNWQLRSNATTTGGSWVSAGTNSSVEYNITGTSTAGGRILAGGYFTSTASTSVSVDVLRAALFSFQLERNKFTSTPYEITLAITAKTSSEYVYGALDWEEISR